MAEFERIRDRDLLRRFRAGDREGFAEIYRVHHAPVYRFALLMTADSVKAVEITQDVFVWLIHHSEGFDPSRGELKSFLVGVARKLVKHRSSVEQRWVPLEEDIVAEAEQVNSDETEFDLARLRQAVTALPVRYREVVVLCDLQEKTYEEAAAVIECAVGTIRSRLHRARALLARKLIGKDRNGNAQTLERSVH